MIALIVQGNCSLANPMQIALKRRPLASERHLHVNWARLSHMSVGHCGSNRLRSRCRRGCLFPVPWREFLLFRQLSNLREQGGVVRLTDCGMYYWVVMKREFLTGVNRLRDQMRVHVRQEIERARKQPGIAAAKQQFSVGSFAVAAPARRAASESRR